MISKFLTFIKKVKSEIAFSGVNMAFSPTKLTKVQYLKARGTRAQVEKARITNVHKQDHLSEVMYIFSKQQIDVEFIAIKGLPNAFR